MRLLHLADTRRLDERGIDRVAIVPNKGRNCKGFPSVQTKLPKPSYYPTLRCMALKLSSRQQAQLAFLDAAMPKMQRIQALIEKLQSPNEAESASRSLVRMLDELKSGAAALSLSGVSQTAAVMSGLARKTGGLHTKLRGLREGMAGLKINYDGARKVASKPAEVPEGPARAN
jgi:hypothetical protein